MPWVIHYTRARIRMAKGDTRGAYQDIEAALGIVRRWRLAILPADSVRTGTGVRLAQVHSTYIEIANRLYFETGRDALARRSFEVAEQARALALRESLDETADLRRRLAPEYWEVLDQLGRAEAAVFRDHGATTSQMVDRLHARLTELEVAAGLERPESQTNATIERGISHQIQQRLSASEALFSFQIREEGSYLWALTNNRFELHPLAGAERIARDVEAFRQTIESSTEGPTAGHRLYQILFGKVASEILEKPQWIILPDGPLFEAPISALVSGRNREGKPVYLVENHSCRILPSAALLLKPSPEPWQ
ncbi:MAG: CHAT domain-containing protein, partial [bacterium]|nr:CHAT domain-containing protein [bacterium]